MKKRLRELLAQQCFDEIANLAGGKRRVLGLLISLTYDREPLIGWRAVEAMGAAAQRVAQDDPDCVRDFLRRLYWLMSEESGGICWRSPEAMAEIAVRLPELAEEYVSIVVSLLKEMADEDLNHFRVGILWAIGRLGPLAEKELTSVLPSIKACLDHPDPQVRGLAVRCLGRCGRQELIADREDLREDDASLTVYENGRLDNATVCQLVQRAVETKRSTAGGDLP
jgi:hypothetical protein